MSAADESSWVPERIDLERPSAARLYDYYLGGSYNFAPDRELAHRIFETFPEMPYLARANRQFLRRVVSYLVGECGIRQFVDVGCGLPTGGAVHEIAQRVDPTARVLYVDNEPVAVAHSDLMLEDNAYAEVLQGDLAEPESLFASGPAQRLIDPSEPVAVLLVAVMHFIGDEQDPGGILQRYRAHMPAGSYVALSHVSQDTLPSVQGAADLYKQSQNTAHLRTRSEVASMLAPFPLVEPGLVFVPEWRPEHPDDAEDAHLCSFYGAVGQVGA